MIEARSLEYTYDGGVKLSYPDISCERGTACLLLGASGSGKTTLLHMLAGILSPSKGSIIFDGKDIVKHSKSEMNSFRGKEIGIVFQRPHFVNALSVLDNLCLAQRLAGLNVDKKKAKELLVRLNIGQKANVSVKALSQGEKQRVAIARAIINEPSLILADEPTSALDDNNAKEVLALLQDVSKETNASLLIVTHDNRLTDVVKKQITLDIQQVKTEQS
jgi:ABC-type lipoprotein export system ATPase subunit